MLICDNCKGAKDVKYVSVTMEVLDEGEQEIVVDYGLDLCGECRTRQKAAVQTAKITTLSGGKRTNRKT